MIWIETPIVGQQQEFIALEARKTRRLGGEYIHTKFALDTLPMCSIVYLLSSSKRSHVPINPFV